MLDLVVDLTLLLAFFYLGYLISLLSSRLFSFIYKLKFHFLHIYGYDHQAGKLSSRSTGHDDVLQASHVDSPLSQLPSQTTEGESSVSGQASEYDETESGRAV